MAEPVLRALRGTPHAIWGAEPLAKLVAPKTPVVEEPTAEFDAALLLDGSTRTAIAAWKAGIPKRIGWATGARGLFLSEALRPPLERGGVPLGLGQAGRWPRRMPRPFTAASVELAGRLGITVSDRVPKLQVLEQERVRVRRRTGDGKYWVLQGGARPGSSKGHPPERWNAILQAVRARGNSTPIFVLAGPGEEAVAREIQGEGVEHVLDPVASLPSLVAWCAGAELFLGADGGPRHVAAAVGTRRVTVMGPTDPRHTTEAQRGEAGGETGGETVLRHEVPCGPCHQEDCPLELECHTGIEEARVVEAILGLASE